MNIQIVWGSSDGNEQVQAVLGGPEREGKPRKNV